MARNPVTANVSTPTAVSTVSDEKKRQASKSSYINSEGEPTRSPTDNTIGMRFAFDGVATPLDCMFADLPANIRDVYCVAQGANIKVQRSFNTAKGNASQMFDEASSTWQNMVDGIWTSDREGGLRIGDLADAIKATLADEGETVDDDRFARIKETLKDESKRDKAKASPKVQAHLTRILAEKAAKRAAEAGEAASKSTGTAGLTDF